MADLQEQREKRRQQFLDWPIEKELPQELGPYKLTRLDEQKDRVYYAWSYVNEENGWAVRALFDEETMDYMVKTDFRLFTITDIDLITGDFAVFKRAVAALLPGNMKRELLDRSRVSVLVEGQYFRDWDYQAVLPPEMGEYKRVIDPSEPVLGLNGSYVIAAYECREKNAGVLFFYNMYRNEYYGEMRVHGNPIIIHEYDAATANDLGKKIKERLSGDLEKLSRGELG